MEYHNWVQPHYIRPKNWTPKVSLVVKNEDNLILPIGSILSEADFKVRNYLKDYKSVTVGGQKERVTSRALVHMRAL